VSKSDYAENKVNELLVGKTAFTLPTAYVALYTAAPSDAGGGTEVTGGSYARKVTAGTDWNTSSAGSISNANAITFVTATASWGTATHFGVHDALSAGNLLFWAALGTSKAIGSGDTASFAAGALVHTED
jgi:hypothetical protein